MDSLDAAVFMAVLCSVLAPILIELINLQINCSKKTAWKLQALPGAVPVLQRIDLGRIDELPSSPESNASEVAPSPSSNGSTSEDMWELSSPGGRHTKLVKAKKRRGDCEGNLHSLLQSSFE